MVNKGHDLINKKSEKEKAKKAIDQSKKDNAEKVDKLATKSAGTYAKAAMERKANK